MLRLVTLNFWGTHEPFRARMELAKRQLAALKPDVLCLQEVSRVGESTTAHELADFLGMNCVTSNELAVLARDPIGEHTVTPLPEPRPDDARFLLSARVDTAAGDVWCHSAHLHYRLDDGVAREKQVVAIDDVVSSIDSERPQLLCGDFNSTPDHDEIRFLRGLTTLAGRRTHYQDAFMRIHPDAKGLTWSAENEQTRAWRSLDIDRRIDFVFVTSRAKDGRGSVHDARVVLDERDGDGHCASDHYGVLADVQISPSAA